MKVLGHSPHPMLIVFPLGLLATAVIFDLIYILRGDPTFALVSYWMMAAGIIGGLVAAIFGWIDWFGIQSETRAKSIGLAHGLVNVGVLVLFAASWLLRASSPDHPSLTASMVAVFAAGFALIGGWLGGELVERLGVSVHKNANADAPSSLKTDNVLINPAQTTKKI